MPTSLNAKHWALWPEVSFDIQLVQSHIKTLMQQINFITFTHLFPLTALKPCKMSKLEKRKRKKNHHHVCRNMTNAQTCLYLLKCARMTMLTAWPNIRKSLLHLMLLAELFSKGRAGKIVMLPWASGWSGRGRSPTHDWEMLVRAWLCAQVARAAATPKRAKMTLYILLVRPSSGCTGYAQCERPATENELHAW